MKYKTQLNIFFFVVVMAYFTGSTNAALPIKTASSALHQLSVSNGYEQELARLNQSITALQKLANKQPRSWPRRERLANALLDRAKLTGDIEDYVTANAEIQRAFDVAKDNSGPLLSRAALNFSMHRLPEVEADLIKAESALLLDKASKNAINGLRADVLLHSGQYIEARTIYERSEKNSPDFTTAVKQAFYFVAVADFEKAEHWFDVAETRIVGRSPLQRSWLQLQLGILDLEQAQWKQAYHHYDKARILFPGHWLIEEHIAEVEALLGYSRKAEKKYRSLVERTNSPVLMSALAGLLQERNNDEDNAESELWLQRASAKFKSDMTQVPELVSGHALDFYLQSNDDTLALQLAKQNYQLRPAGPAAIALAQAHAIRGQFTHSLSLLENVLATPFSSAELHATAASVYRATNQPQNALVQEQQALMLSPAAMNDVAWLERVLLINTDSAVRQ